CFDRICRGDRISVPRSGSSRSRCLSRSGRGTCISRSLSSNTGLLDHGSSGHSIISTSGGTTTSRRLNRGRQGNRIGSSTSTSNSTNTWWCLCRSGHGNLLSTSRRRFNRIWRGVRFSIGRIRSGISSGNR
ncbi:unnamed protein product, partial [Ectocarpus sp. 8 AP-2014]